MTDLNAILENVKDWVREVGAIQVEKIEENIEYHAKSSAIDLVTEVDILSEKLLMEKIKASYPDHGILSEEAGRMENESEYIWVIDPLDGTNNYFHGYPIFGISIALKHKDETLLGAVYVPKLNELFYAVKGQGAFMNGKRLQVSTTDNLRGSLLGTGFPYDKATDEGNNVVIFNNLILDIMGIRRSGSAAFDLCCVAAGRLDGFWELKLKPWDVEAGALIIKEAGGRVLGIGTSKGINIIAGNEKIAEILQERIKGCYGKFFESK